jgi:hypothetical protein
MVSTRAPFRIFAALTFLLTMSAAANAQATRTWVSRVGDDVNPCSLTAPRKTYAGAISKTAVRGEISTLDPGGFVTVTKSITIEGPSGTVLPCGNNRFAGNGGVSTVTAVGVMSNEFGQQ